MPDSRGRSGALLVASISLLLVLPASCRFDDGALDEANGLNRSAGEKIKPG